MQYELLISPTALIETGNAYNYYEKQSDGLGNRFLKSLDEAHQKLSQSPQFYGYINSRKDLRDIKIKGFPFIIIFQIVKDKVLVLRVFNTKPDPPYLKIYRSLYAYSSK
ncbi:MAG: type II toxin-antitoxin system RelE/ParE family toxin [Ginsengibacter sp.]